MLGLRYGVPYVDKDVYHQIVIFFFLAFSFIGVANSDSTGSVTGTISEADSGDPLASINIQLYDKYGEMVGSSSTDATGKYHIQHMERGNYYVVTDNDAGYIDEYYPDEICGRPCYPENKSKDMRGDYILFAQPITVRAGTVTSKVDISLQKGGRISGVISDDATGEPIAYKEVHIYDEANAFVESTSTDALGRFVTSEILYEGGYYVNAHVAGYLGQRYGAPHCFRWQCDSVNGTLVNVTPGKTSENINLNLKRGGNVSGFVRDSKTGDAVTDAVVNIFDENGYVSGTRVDNSDGTYQFDYQLPPGEYYVDVVETSQHIPTKVCPQSHGCNENEKVIIVEGNVTENINFYLERGGKISGKVTDQSTGQPISDARVRVFDSDKAQVGFALTDHNGTYITGSNLDSGMYYVAALIESEGYMQTCYPNVACLGDHSTSDFSSAEQVSVTKGEVSQGINIALEKGATISGRVTDSETGDPYSGGSISVFDSDGNKVSRDRINSDGQYITSVGLPAGKYYVSLSYSLDGYRVCEFYGSVPCDQTPSYNKGGQPIEINAENNEINGIDFQIAVTGANPGFTVIPVTIKDKADSQPIANVRIITSPESSPTSSFSFDIETEYTDAQGRYLLKKSFGNYFIRTSNSKGYFDEVFASGVCEGTCKPDDFLNPLNLSEDSAVSGIEFELDKGGLIGGKLTDEQLIPYRYLFVRIYSQDGEYVSYGFTDNAGVYHSRGGLSGTYFVQAYGYANDISLIYPNTHLANISSFNELTPLSLSPGEVRDDIDFVFSNKGFSISGYIDDIDTGDHISGVDILIFNRDGIKAGRATTLDGWFQSVTLAPGEYYVVATSTSYQDLIYGGANFSGESDCTGSQLFYQCDLSKFENATKVEITDQDLVGINFSLKAELADEQQLSGEEATSGLLCYTSYIRRFRIFR